MNPLSLLPLLLAFALPACSSMEPHAAKPTKLHLAMINTPDLHFVDAQGNRYVWDEQPAVVRKAILDQLNLPARQPSSSKGAQEDDAWLVPTEADPNGEWAHVSNVTSGPILLVSPEDLAALKNSPPMAFPTDAKQVEPKP